MKKPLFLAWIILSPVLLLLLCEGLLYGYYLSGSGDKRVQAVFRDFYQKRDRRILQLQPDCVQYDEKLTYRLRPPGCRYTNREYSTDVRVNSLGVRDDEGSLIAPHTIVLGDSHAFGWGVAEKEAFPALLEVKSGEKVLNAGIPSYGTAREVLLLDSLDTTKLRTLIVQYCSNDITENVSFDLKKRTLEISTREEFQKSLEIHQSEIRYFPGKFLRYLFPEVVRGLREEEPRSLLPLMTDAPVHAKKFLEILSTSPTIQNGDEALKIIVLHMDSFALHTNAFIHEVLKQSRVFAYPKALQSLAVLDTSQILRPLDTFQLDDHMRASGHRRIADALLEALQR